MSTVTALLYGSKDTHRGVDLIFEEDGPVLTVTLQQARDMHEQLTTIIAILDEAEGCSDG